MTTYIENQLSDAVHATDECVAAATSIEAKHLSQFLNRPSLTGACSKPKLGAALAAWDKASAAVEVCFATLARRLPSDLVLPAALDAQDRAAILALVAACESAQNGKDPYPGDASRWRALADAACGGLQRLKQLAQELKARTQRSARLADPPPVTVFLDKPHTLAQSEWAEAAARLDAERKLPAKDWNADPNSVLDDIKKKVRKDFKP